MRTAFVSVGVVLALSAGASADLLVIDLAGWQAESGFGGALNTNASFNFPIGTTIDNAEYVDLTYTAQGASWQSELVLSLNDDIGGDFWDSGIAGTVGAPGAVGPVSGPFANPGLFASGPFSLTTGTLYVETYDTFNDAGVDQVIASGSLHVHYTIPEPATAGLLGAGALLLSRRWRRRQA